MKDRWNKKVFNWCWNDRSVGAETTVSGSEFQICEAATTDALVSLHTVAIVQPGMHQSNYQLLECGGRYISADLTQLTKSGISTNSQNSKTSSTVWLTHECAHTCCDFTMIVLPVYLTSITYLLKVNASMARPHIVLLFCTIKPLV